MAVLAYRLANDMGRAMIVDSHVHIFPFLGSPSGYPSWEEHMRYIQFNMTGFKREMRAGGSTPASAVRERDGPGN